MSLIAEALRAAQREKELRQGDPEHRAEVLLRPGSTGWGAPLERLPRRKRPQLFLVLGGVATVALALGAVAVYPAREPTPVRLQKPELSAVAPKAVQAEASTTQSPAPPAIELPPPTLEGAGSASASGTPAPRAPSASRRQSATGESRSSDVRIEVGSDGAPTEVQALFAEAVHLHRAGKYRDAVELYRRVLDSEADDPRVFNNLGSAWLSLGERERAQEAFRRAIELDPRYAAAWSNLGLVLEATGAPNEALAAFRTALELDPGNPSASVNLAIRYHESGLLEEAERLLEEALGRDPLMPEAHYELGRLSETQGDKAKARLHYSRFLELGADRFPEIAARVRARLERLSP